MNLRAVDRNTRQADDPGSGQPSPEVGRSAGDARPASPTRIGGTARLLPIADGEGDRPKPRRGEGGWRGAGRTAPPHPSTILRMVPLPIRCANREETPTAHNPPIVSISPAANSLTSLAFQNKQRHQPSWPGPVSDSCPSRRWGGRRIQRPDVGGLWSSDEARGMDTPGVLAEVDGWPAPARRAPMERTAGCAMSLPRPGQ